MTFKQWWDETGTRLYADTHEERARQAWEACERTSTPLSMKDLLKHHDLDYGG